MLIFCSQSVDLLINAGHSILFLVNVTFEYTQVVWNLLQETRYDGGDWNSNSKHASTQDWTLKLSAIILLLFQEKGAKPVPVPTVSPVVPHLFFI